MAVLASLVIIAIMALNIIVSYIFNFKTSRAITLWALLTFLLFNAATLPYISYRVAIIALVVLQLFLHYRRK